MKAILLYLVFPGFLFTAILGMFISWVDRKVTARVQWRKGPPILQPLYDIVKLLGKELILPEGASVWTFLVFPLFGLASVALASTIIWLSFFNPASTFIGDFIVILYFLTVPAIVLIVASFASANPLASVGASREMKLVLSYELPFILASLVPILKAGTIRLGGLVGAQATGGLFIGSLSGAIAFIVILLCTQAKLGLVPFDMAEAETEIMAGAYIEFSGPALAIFKLTKFMSLVAMPMFVVLLFMGNTITSLASFIGIVLKYVLVIVLVVLIRNTAPRVRIDQAMRFFWLRLAPLSLIAIILALKGL